MGFFFDGHSGFYVLGLHYFHGHGLDTSHFHVVPEIDFTASVVFAALACVEHLVPEHSASGGLHDVLLKELVHTILSDKAATTIGT